MKRFIVTITFALTMIIAIPTFGQTTAADWQKKVDSLQLKLKMTNDNIEAANEAALNAKTQDEKAEAQKDRQSALDDNHKVAAELRTAKEKLKKAQAAEGISATPNNDPTPPVVEGEEVNDSSMVSEEAATDSIGTTEEAAAKEAEGSSLPWWLYLLMIGLPILCSGLVYFILNNKIDELKMRLRADNQATQRALNQRIDSVVDKTDRIETSMRTVRQDIRNRDFVSPTPQPSPYGQPTQPVQPKRPTEFYLSMPSADGTWSEVSTVNTQGQCLYILNSPNGINGTFKVINEPIAIQMILMGVGKYLNPVCRVSNTASQVNGIVTDEPGTAVFENGVWRMTKKAVVHYV